MTLFVISQVRAHPILRRALAQAAVVGLAATLAAVIAWSWSRPVLTTLEHAPADAWLRARAPIPLTPDLVLITRDAAGEAKFGPGRWDRAIVARMIRALSHAGAAVIALDIPAATPSPPGHGGPASDAMLAEMTKSAGNVIYPLPLTPGTPASGSKRDEPAGEPHPAHPAWRTADASLRDSLLEAQVAADALAPGALAARNLGHTLAVEDFDDTVRRVPLFVRVGPHAVPAFGVAVAAAFLNVPPDRITIAPGRTVVLRSAPDQAGPAEDLTIPMSADGTLMINYTPQRSGRRFSLEPFSTSGLHWTRARETSYTTGPGGKS